jgi:hypothetical protein
MNWLLIKRRRWWKEERYYIYTSRKEEGKLRERAQSPSPSQTHIGGKQPKDILSPATPPYCCCIILKCFNPATAD